MKGTVCLVKGFFDQTNVSGVICDQENFHAGLSPFLPVTLV